MMRLTFLLLLLVAPLCADEPQCNVVVDLRNPLYEAGVLSTTEGGILTASGLRIQAQNLVYTRDLSVEPPILTVQCEGNLLIDYKQWTLVGDFLYYDFITNTGYLINGCTAQPPWYVGGEEMLLLDSGELRVINGYLTTSEGEGEDVVVRSPEITLTPNRIVTARNLNFWVGKAPLFWFPKLKLDLENRGRSPFAVKFGWGGFLGSHLSLLYRFLAIGDLKGVARIDGFFGHGLGGGIETHYNPKYRPTEFYTRNYYAHDIAIDDRRKRDRYRFEGTFFDCIGGVEIDGIYDVVSDAQMAADFQTKDFDLNTAGRTQIGLRKQESGWIARLFTRVRVNDFQSVNQELPTFSLHLHPFEIPTTGIYTESTFQASYLDYVFSDDVTNGEDFNSSRIFNHTHFYRPFLFGPFTATPEAGFVGIGYSNSPGGKSAGQAIGELGFRFETSLSKCWSELGVKHVFAPYLHYHYFAPPTVNTDNHYIFTINDGYDRLNLFRFGVTNSFFIKAPCGVTRPLWFDIWSNAFFNEETLPQALPKGYYNLEWQPYDRLFLGSEGGWNFREKQVDFWNGRIDWTLSDDIACGLEYRYRSPYDWRKANFYNFILETVRPQSKLLTSPLSDKRRTLLFRTFARLNPDWSLKLDLRHGKNASNDRTFLEYQAELGRVFFQHWRFLFIYERREADDRYSVSLKLDPGPPPKRRK